MRPHTDDHTKLIAHAAEIDRAEWQAEHNALRRAGRAKPDPCEPETHGIPLINYAPAGESLDYTDLDYHPGAASRYIPRGEVTDPLAFAFIVVGDSMLPAYGPGDICICGGSRHPMPGDDCFVRFSQDAREHAGECTFKRVDFVPGAVVLTPLNPQHRVRIVPREDVVAVYPIIEKRVRRLGAALGLGCSHSRAE